MPRATAPASAPASLLLLLFALLPLAADALFFNVQQGQQRCFIEEMPGQTLLVATYKNPDFKPFGTPGFSDTSVAIRDAIAMLSVPVIEVHLSNIHRREAFRQHSYFSDLAEGVILGLGAAGYRLALEAALDRLGAPPPQAPASGS